MGKKYKNFFGWVIIIIFIVLINAMEINISMSFKDYNFFGLLIIPVLFIINFIMSKIQKTKKGVKNGKE